MIILATIRLTKPTSRAITVGIAIATSKILAATLKTAQQSDRASDSSKITHMHIDAIHTYERSSSNNSTHKAYESHHRCHHRCHHRITATKIMAETLKITQQHNRESDSSKITNLHIDAIHTYERSS